MNNLNIPTKHDKVKVGQYFQGYWSAVAWRKTQWRVVEVISPCKVVIEEIGMNDQEPVAVLGKEDSPKTITKRRDHIWREESSKKTNSSMGECGDRFYWFKDAMPVRDYDRQYYDNPH